MKTRTEWQKKYIDIVGGAVIKRTWMLLSQEGFHFPITKLLS